MLGIEKNGLFTVTCMGEIAILISLSFFCPTKNQNYGHHFASLPKIFYLKLITACDNFALFAILMLDYQLLVCFVNIVFIF